MSVRCIFQLVYIQRLRAGLTRFDNDLFDNVFHGLTWDSAEIWGEQRQKVIANAVLVPVHSHNDEWRRIPLFEALASGCISVEADVHLVDGDLLVGHSLHSLRSSHNLRSMYLQPLERILGSRNAASHGDDVWRGIFDRKPEQTVVLLVDHKSDGAETLSELDRQLEPLRDLKYLTYWNGATKVVRPLTIVASGNAPFDSILALNGSHRDIFFDAPLERLRSIRDDFSIDPPVYGYNQSNSHYASTPWQNMMLHRWRDQSLPPPSTPFEKDKARSQPEQATARGLVSRYWDTPTNPQNLRETAWRVLVDAKVGVLNMDDMGAVRDRARGWGRVRRT